MVLGLSGQDNRRKCRGELSGIILHGQKERWRQADLGCLMKQPTHSDLVKGIKKLITEHGDFVYKHYSGGLAGLTGVGDP